MNLFEFENKSNKFHYEGARQRLTESDTRQFVHRYLPWLQRELKIDRLPEIELLDDPVTTSFGQYSPEDKTIKLVVGGRHPVDVLRTIAHELTHYKQDLAGDLEPGAGETGTPQENEANSNAGIVMRNFAKANPKYFGIKDTLTESTESNDKLDAVLTILCKMILDAQEKDPEQYGLVAAAVIDPKQNCVLDVNYTQGDQHVHAERAAIEKYQSVHGKLPPGCTIVTTLSPCSQAMAERVGSSCQDLLNQSRIAMVYCGYMDPTQTADGAEFAIAETNNGKLKNLCSRIAHTFLDKQDMAEGLIETRNSLFAFVKQHFPTWPDYVLKDFLYQQAKGIRDQAELDFFLKRNKKDFGNCKWTLVELPITFDIFTPKTQRMIKSREGGNSNPFRVPRDAERHALQSQMIQQKGVSSEPIIVAKLSNGYDLIEGWHRTIQHLKAFPQGYTGPAWVCTGATYKSESVEQGVAEGSENNNTIAQKIFFARSVKAPKGWSYDHVGFITQDGRQIQMSGHKGNDVYVTNNVTDDPEFPKQNIKIVSLSKPVSVPATNSVGAENCGTFVANVLQANGIKGIDTEKIYSVFKQPQKQGVAEGKVKLYTDPSYFGAEVDDTGFDSLAIVDIPANQLVGFEPDDKMNQPKSKANVEKIVAGLKQGAKLPPLLVRKYKNGYQVLDGHHRFWAYKLLGVKSIPSRIVPDEDIEEISKQGVAENFADGKKPGRKGLAKRSGVNTKASVSSLRKTAKHSTGEKARMAHWLANMKAGKAKAKKKHTKEDISRRGFLRGLGAAGATVATGGALAKKPTESPITGYYQVWVKPGDTVYSIARGTASDPRDIMKINGFNNKTRLEKDQLVKIPEYGKHPDHPLKKTVDTSSPKAAEPTKRQNAEPPKHAEAPPQNQTISPSTSKTALEEPEFLKKLVQVARELGVSAKALFGIINHESRFRHHKQNPKTHAIGLIQFVPKTARQLGTSTEQLAKMSATEQLDYVYRYYKNAGVKPGMDIGDMYMYTFIPGYVRQPENTVLGKKDGGRLPGTDLSMDLIWKQNPVFSNGLEKPYFTIADVKNRIAKFMP